MGLLDGVKTMLELSEGFGRTDRGDNEECAIGEPALVPMGHKCHHEFKTSKWRS